jgi:hypothetical protein
VENDEVEIDVRDEWIEYLHHGRILTNEERVVKRKKFLECLKLLFDDR